MTTCPCGSNQSYEECCLPVIKGAPALTAEQLMRSRYTAYAMQETDFLYASLHPDNRADYDANATRAWAQRSQWHNLEILSTTAGGPDDAEGTVEFIATYSEQGVRRDHHEMAYFKKEDESWYFVTGEPVRPKQFVREAPKVGRNDPCPCGSGKKYKKCCIS